MSNNFSFSQKFVSGEAHFGFWNFISKGLGAINTFFIIGALTVYQYGVFQLLLSLYAILSPLISLGGFAAGTDILRFIGEGREDKAKRLFWEFNSLRLLSAILLWALFFFGAPFLSFRYGPDFISVIRVISFLFLTELFVSISKFLLSARLNFGAVASRDAIGKIFQLGVLLYFYFFENLGLKEVFFSVVAAPFFSALTLLPQTVKAWEPWRRLLPVKEQILWGIVKAHGKWASLRSFFSQFTNRIQPWLIKIFISTEAVGIYSVALSIADLFTEIMPTYTLGTLVPRQIQDKERSKMVFNYSSKYLIIFAMVAVVGGLLTVPFAVNFIFPKYLPSLPFFFLLLALLPIRIFWQVVDTFLVALRQQKFVFFRMLGRNLLGLLLLLVLLPWIGLWGVVLTEVAVVISIMLVSYRRFIFLEPSFKLNFAFLISYGEEDRILLKSLYKNFKRFFA